MYICQEVNIYLPYWGTYTTYHVRKEEEETEDSSL